MSSIVYLHTRHGKLMPITKGIESVEHLQTAYNILYHMAELNIQVNAGDGFQPIQKNDLYAKDDKWKFVDVPFDREWYGQPQDNMQAKEAEIDRLEQMAIEDGDGDLFDRKLVRETMVPYVIMAQDENANLITLSPKVWSESKANEMYNAIKYGIRKSVALQDASGNKIDRDSIRIYANDVVVGQEENPSWAEEPFLTNEDLKGLDMTDNMSK